MKRGDIVLLSFPFSSGTGAKIRPALVVQCDRNNRRLRNTIVAMITSSTRAATEPTQLVIDPATPDGQSSGLLHASALKCENLFTVEQALVLRTIGALSPLLLTRLDGCLKASLELI